MKPKPLAATIRALLGSTAILATSALAVEKNPDRQVFFGQTHSHTSWSVDAYLIGNHLTTPEDAYKYSMGLPIKHPAGFDVQIRGRPLDFQGVTDHSEYAGVISMANDPNNPLSKTAVGKRLQAKTPAEFNAVFQWIAGSLAKHEPIKELVSPEIAGTVWQKTIEIADKYYNPGKFTTFVAYEWTSAPNFRNMHRNVFFRDSKHVPALPFTAIDSLKPEDLWVWMDDQRKKGNELLGVIGHGGEVERTAELRRPRREAAGVVRREADRLALREAIRAARVLARAGEDGVGRVRGVHVRVAEVRLAIDVEARARLTRLGAPPRPGRGLRERRDRGRRDDGGHHPSSVLHGVPP